MKTLNKVPGLLALLCIITAVMCIAALGLGRYAVNPKQVVEVVFSAITRRPTSIDKTVQDVVLLLRLPRVIAAVLVGAALAVSGSTYQGIFKNPLAAPELLGVFQGSCVGAAIAILLNLGSFPMQFFALAGGIGAVGASLLIARFFKSDSTAILVLAGVIISGLMRSILGLLKYVMDPYTQLPEIVYWELGSLSAVTMKQLAMIAPLMLVSLGVLLALRWQFNILSLGDNEAQSLGINLRTVRGVTVVCSTLLTSSAVCLSGTIAWIGLIIPHLGRMVVGPDNVKLTPVAMFMGAMFLILVDTIARSASGFEIPLSILTGCVGAPLCIILIKNQRMKVR